MILKCPSASVEWPLTCVDFLRPPLALIPFPKTFPFFGPLLPVIKKGLFEGTKQGKWEGGQGFPCETPTFFNLLTFKSLFKFVVKSLILPSAFSSFSLFPPVLPAS